MIKKITTDDYKRCKLKNKLAEKEQFMIRAQKHQIYKTIKQNKVALNKNNKKI